MNSLLDLEPECSTKFFRRFLEIRDGTSKPAKPFERPSGPSSPIISSDMAFSPSEDRKRIFQEVQGALFDLSANPSLLEPAEVEQRHARYVEIFNLCVAESRGQFTPYHPPEPIPARAAIPPRITPHHSEIIVNLS